MKKNTLKIRFIYLTYIYVIKNINFVYFLTTTTE